MAKKKNLLITGRPGVGKTTLIQRVAEGIEGKLAGFVTEEIRDRSGKRNGFRAIPFGGDRVTIASVDRAGGPRVSKYGVDVEAIDRLAEETLELRDNADVYLIDEIGKMECLSERFVEAVERLLDSEKPVIATIGKQGPGLIASAKKRDDADVWEVTEANRNELADKIVRWLRGNPDSRPNSGAHEASISS
jgi:nucleoside-triphosphatase